MKEIVIITEARKKIRNIEGMLTSPVVSAQPDRVQNLLDERQMLQRQIDMALDGIQNNSRLGWEEVHED